jgi:hypothetical protein
LWDLLEKATALGMTPILLNFPRFAYDFDYLWKQVQPIVEQRQSEESALAAWGRVVDPTMIRIVDSDPAKTTNVRIRELQGIVEILRRQNQRILAANSIVMAQRDEAIAQRDEAIAQQKGTINGRIRSSSGWYRRLRAW